MTEVQRDNQKQRVYNAEKSVYKFGQTIPTNELQAYANKVLDKRAIRSRWGTRNVRVELGRSSGSSYGGRITLGVACRNEWVMLHELAHELAPREVKHGPEFVGIYLFLVNLILGKDEADRLKAAFKEQRVRSSRKAIPAVQQFVPASRADRARAQKKVHREESLARVSRWLRDGYITKADLRRLAA
jgi:hypothetical protein